MCRGGGVVEPPDEIRRCGDDLTSRLEVTSPVGAPLAAARLALVERLAATRKEALLARQQTASAVQADPGPAESMGAAYSSSASGGKGEGRGRGAIVQGSGGRQ